MRKKLLSPRPGQKLLDPLSTPLAKTPLMECSLSRIVVVAVEPDTRECYVVTVYPPDPELWNSDFRTRRA
jgi:hypothetical protein